MQAAGRAPAGIRFVACVIQNAKLKAVVQLPNPQD